MTFVERKKDPSATQILYGFDVTKDFEVAGIWKVHLFKQSFIIMLILICSMPLCLAVLVLGKLLDSVPRALMVPWAEQDFDPIELLNYLSPVGT